jgi:hypothetical protein
VIGWRAALVLRVFTPKSASKAGTASIKSKKLNAVEIEEAISALAEQPAR